MDQPNDATPSRPSAIARPAGAELFLVSFRHRDELLATATRSGWRAIAARRADDADRRFVDSGAAVALVDARGALDDGLAAIVRLAGPIQSNAAALLVLVSRGDVGALDRLYDAGATHFLASPFGETEVIQALRFAARHAERLGGPRRVAGAAMSWELDTGTGAVALSPALAERLAVAATSSSLARFVRLLDRGDRRSAIGAARRLRGAEHATAFAHDLPGDQRVAHHVIHDRETGQVGGRIEPLGAPPDPPAARGGRDRLSGLADGPAARARIGERLAAGEPTLLLLVAITRFDGVNAAYGRAIGDALLRAAARRIERLASDAGGPQALVARAAGAEFLIVMGGGIDRARLLATTVVDALGRPFVVDGAMLTLGAHVGIAEATGDESADAAVRRASTALIAARGGEGDPIRVLSGEDARADELARALEADLREALARGEIEILFQPQVRLVGGAIEGVEALARWRHPTHGTLGAETLFATADRAGLSLALSNAVQAQAIATAAAWPVSLSRLRLSINVTAADIAQPDFCERLLALADQHGFPRSRLTLEVTESGLIADLSAAAELLARLRAAGCRVAIDDFGTGYSSLAYLKALPLDYLKIDKRLAQDIAGSSRDRVVVRGVIDMARSLGLAVVAEGVETEEQLALLAAEGCTFYQGFLCAGPLTVGALETLVLSGKSPLP